MSTSDCIFCKIISGTIPGDIVYRDDQVTAFRDIHPHAPVDILVVPNRHIAALTEVTPDDTAVLGALLQAAAAVARQQGIADSGYRVVINAGPDAGQSIDHLHLHVLGGRSLAWPPG